MNFTPRIGKDSHFGYLFFGLTFFCSITAHAENIIYGAVYREDIVQKSTLAAEYARVELIASDGSTAQTVRTCGNAYIFHNVPTGTYTVRATRYDEGSSASNVISLSDEFRVTEREPLRAEDRIFQVNITIPLPEGSVKKLRSGTKVRRANPYDGGYPTTDLVHGRFVLGEDRQAVLSKLQHVESSQYLFDGFANIFPTGKSDFNSVKKNSEWAKRLYYFSYEEIFENPNADTQEDPVFFANMFGDVQNRIAELAQIGIEMKIVKTYRTALRYKVSLKNQDNSSLNIQTLKGRFPYIRAIYPLTHSCTELQDGDISWPSFFKEPRLMLCGGLQLQ